MFLKKTSVDDRDVTEPAKIRFLRFHISNPPDSDVDLPQHHAKVNSYQLISLSVVELRRKVVRDDTDAP